MSETCLQRAYHGGRNAGRSVRVPRPRSVSKVDRMPETGYRKKVLKVPVFRVLKESKVLLVAVVEVQSLIGYKQLQVFIHFLMLELEPQIP